MSFNPPPGVEENQFEVIMFSRNVTMFVSRGGMNRGPLWCYVSHMSSGGAGKYAGKVVIVSGASSGIGEEVSLQYAKQGANLVVSARREEKLTDVADRCRQAAIDAGTSGSTKAVVADVSVEEDCKRMVAAAVTQFGGVDILVLNAGVGQVCTLWMWCTLFLMRLCM